MRNSNQPKKGRSSQSSSQRGPSKPPTQTPSADTWQLSKSQPKAPTPHPDTLRTLRFHAWPPFPDPQRQLATGTGRWRLPSGVRRPILARLCRAVGRLYGRPTICAFAGQADAFLVFSGQSMQRNVQQPPHRFREPVVARGRCSRLRAFASGGLSSDRAWGPAGVASLSSASRPSGGVGALGRGAGAYSGTPTITVSQRSGGCCSARESASNAQ
jgi:hypothetical protein